MDAPELVQAAVCEVLRFVNQKHPQRAIPG